MTKRTRELVVAGDIDGARQYVTGLTWTGPPAFWWCDTAQELAVVIQKIYGVLRQQHKGDGYDVGFIGPRVAQLLIWVD